MTSYRNKFFLAAAVTLSLAGTAHAESIYGTVLFGKNIQEGDTEPYGNNIAADPDFPGHFDSGEGTAGALGIGFAFNSIFRIEGRLGLHRADFNNRRFGSGARDGEEYILDGDIEAQP